MSADNVTPILPPSGESRQNKGRPSKPPHEVLRFRQPDDQAAIQADMLLIALRYQFAAIEKILNTEDGEGATMASYLAMGGQQLVAFLEGRLIDTDT